VVRLQHDIKKSIALLKNFLPNINIMFTNHQHLIKEVISIKVIFKKCFSNLNFKDKKYFDNNITKKNL